MQVKKFNISKPKKYTVNGVEKNQWNTVGTLTEFYKQDGTISRILEIPAIGLEASIFPIEPKNQQGQQTAPVAQHKQEYDGSAMPGELPPKEEIQVEDIPF